MYQSFLSYVLRLYECSLWSYVVRFSSESLLLFRNGTIRRVLLRPLSYHSLLVILLKSESCWDGTMLEIMLILRPTM